MRKYDDSYMKAIDILAAFVLAMGGLFWGVVGLFGFNPIATAIGEMSPISRIFYLLFGAAALYEIIFYRMIQRRWDCKPWPAAAETSAA